MAKNFNPILVWNYIKTHFGCHRIPERSFYFKNKQFPVCARCTGVFIGQIIMIILMFFNIIPSLLVSSLLLGVMFIDWFIQYKGLLKSTNFRRLVTGLMGGVGIIGIYYWIIKQIIFRLILQN